MMLEEWLWSGLTIWFLRFRCQQLEGKTIISDCQYTLSAIIYMVAHGHLFIIWIVFLFRNSFQLSDYNSLQYRICILSEAVSVWADTGTLKAVMSHGCVCFFPLTGDFCLPPAYLLTWVCAQFKAWEQCRDVTLQLYNPAKAQLCCACIDAECSMSHLISGQPYWLVFQLSTRLPIIILVASVLSCCVRARVCVCVCVCLSVCLSVL